MSLLFYFIVKNLFSVDKTINFAYNKMQGDTVIVSVTTTNNFGLGFMLWGHRRWGVYSPPLFIFGDFDDWNTINYSVSCGCIFKSQAYFLPKNVFSLEFKVKMHLSFK